MLFFMIDMCESIRFRPAQILIKFARNIVLGSHIQYVRIHKCWPAVQHEYGPSQQAQDAADELDEFMLSRHSTKATRRACGDLKLRQNIFWGQFHVAQAPPYCCAATNGRSVTLVRIERWNAQPLRSPCLVRVSLRNACSAYVLAPHKNQRVCQ